MSESKVTKQTMQDTIVYSDGTSTVYVEGKDEDNHTKITVSRNNCDKYVWVHEDVATEDDFLKMDTLSTDYMSYNVSGYDSLAYTDIVEKASTVFADPENFNDEAVITVELEESSADYLKNYADENNISMEDALRTLIIEHVQVQKGHENNDAV